MATLTLGYSPCPNDTFIFYALVHGLIDTGGLSFKETLLDVETLNEKAERAGLDITKVSYYAFASLRKEYCLLHSGGAMGKGCGPLIVAREDLDMKDLMGKRIAIPGRLTTAFLLLQLYDPTFKGNVAEMRFDEVMPSVKDSKVDAGLVIHEGRFTYERYGLKCVLDLGQWWQDKTGLPLPLGGIIVRRSLGKELIAKIDFLIRQSVLYAMENRHEPLGYIKAHAQELNEDVIMKHIGLYVNDYSIDMGEEGITAVNTLIRMAEDAGLAHKSPLPLFISFS